MLLKAGGKPIGSELYGGGYSLIKTTVTMVADTLIQAVISENVIAVQQLLQQGADPNVAEDADNITPLHFAAQRNSAQALQIARLLLQAGADPMAQNHPDGQTPVTVATLMGCKQMVAVLSASIDQV